MWWKRAANKAVEIEALHLMSLLGDQACETAREEARRARGKDKTRARHYSYVALRIEELTGPAGGRKSQAANGAGPRIVERLQRPS